MNRSPSVVGGLLLLLVFGAFGQWLPALSQTIDRNLARQTAVESLNLSAKAALLHGDLDAAQKYFQQSLSISEKVIPATLAVAQSLNGLGDVAQQRGVPPDAEGYYQQALAILQKLDPSGAETANSLDGLARVANDREDDAKAEKYGLQASAIRQKLNPNSLDLALSLNTMAGLYMHRRQWDKAEESYKKALTLQERLAPESLVLAETLKNIGNFFVVRHRYDEAGSYHRRALTIREKLAPGGLAVADSLRWLGICERNDPDARERYYRKALTMQDELAPGSLHVAKTMGLLAAQLQNRGDLKAAEAYHLQALAIWERLVPGGAQMGRAMIDLGDNLVYQGDLAGAEGWAVKSLEANQKIDPGSSDVAYSLFLLGDIANDRRDLTPAEDYYQQALAIIERLDPGSPTSAMMIRGLGEIAEYRGDLAKAEQYYRRALAIYKKTDPNGNRVAQGLFTVGMVLHDRGDRVQAERYYRHALAIWEKVVPQSLFVAEALGKLGQLARDQGDLLRAEGYQRRAVAIEQKSVPGSPDVAQGLNDLGDVLFARGELSEALECHQRALAIREKLLPGTGDHAASLAALATIMNRQGKSDAAAQYSQQALDALESQTARLGGRDALRAEFRARHATYYKNYIDLLIRQKRFDLAFQVLERFRGRILLETLAAAHVDIRQGAAPTLVEKERSLQTALKAKSERRVLLLTEKHTDEQMKGIEKEISDLTSEYQDLEALLRSSSPVYASLTQPHPLNASDIQQLLDPDTLLLEYSLGEESSHVFAVTQESFSVLELPTRRDIEQTARGLYQALTERNRTVQGESEAQKNRRVARAEAAYNRTASQLSRMVLGPVAPQLEGKRLLVVADGALHYIPFAALPEPATQTATDARRFPLAWNHEIVNLPSASVLAVLRQQEARRQPAPKAVAVLADPVFTPRDSRVKGKATARSGIGPTEQHSHPTSELNSEALLDDFSSSLLTRSATDVGLSRSGALSLPRLPFSRREADAIMAVTPEGLGLKAVDFNASRATATNPELAEYRIVHFATHGLLDSQHPELSGLVLSLVDEKGQRQDGFLQLQDIYNMNLAADLVVLSACETGLGKEVSGEGQIGLTRGFMYAGASRVVASLWSVSDIATANLMADFYKAMEQDGMRPAAALRAAQIKMLKQQHWSSPYYWAAFQIQGDWR